MGIKTNFPGKFPQIAPSLLSANFACLGKEITRVFRAGAKIVHLDVMDGHFVPNLTVGSLVLKNLPRYRGIFYDVHLMVTNPERYILPFAHAGADLFCFHYEAVKRPAGIIAKIKKFKMLSGIALKPATAVDKIFPLLRCLDLVLVMTVEPGFAGQEFLYPQLENIARIADYLRNNRLPCQLEVDGGINLETAPLVAAAGASLLVAGSAVFNHSSPGKAWKRLTTALTD